MSKTDSTPLTIERLREVLDYCPETGLFTWLIRTSRRMSIGSIAGSLDSGGYVKISIDSRPYRAHRLAFFWVTGKASKAQTIDHIDRNPANNRFANLREASRSQNGQNASLSKANLSGCKGVYFSPEKDKWHATIGLHDKTFNLGSFSNLSDAIAARKQGEILHHPYRALMQPAELHAPSE